MTKRILSVLLAAVMLLGTMGFSVLAEATVATIGETPYSSLADAVAAVENGDTIVILDNIEDLATIVNGGNDLEGITIKLGTDFDLEGIEWTPIGTNTTPFKGKFDGDNHTISNLKVEGAYSYAGFFGYVRNSSMTDLENPTIQNLIIEDAYIDTTEYNAAGILSAQIFVGAVKNVHTTGTVKGGAKFAGGLVGHVYTSFDNCSFEGDVSSANQSGGIAGSGDGRVYNSRVKGDIDAQYWAGGIIGNGQEGTTIVNCYVEGDVSATNCWYYGVGGLAGVAGHGYSGAKIENNYFNGTVYLAGEKINTPVIGFVNADNNEAINSEVSGNSWNTENYPADLPVIITAEVEQSGTAAEYESKTVPAENQQSSRNNNLVMLESDLAHIDTINPEEVTIMDFSEVTTDEVEDAAEANVVAKVGDVGYATLQEAIIAASPAGTVEVVGDSVVEEWTMFTQNLTIGNDNLITLDMNGLTINGNGHSVTVESIESASNGDSLFHGAENLNIYDLTINVGEGLAGGIGLVSGVIDGVIFNGGNGVFPGEGEITINECEFYTANHVIYYETARDNLTVTNNTFDVGAESNVILLRGNETFTGNTINSGRTVNAVSGTPTISGNTFAEGVRLKIYNDCAATITDNTLTYIEFQDAEAEFSATFAGNTLTDDAKEVFESVGLVAVAKIGDAEYYSVADVVAAVAAEGAIVLVADTTLSAGDAATLAEKTATVKLGEFKLTIESTEDYSDIITIPNKYLLKDTKVTDEEGNITGYTYYLKKRTVAAATGSSSAPAAEKFTVKFDTNGGSDVKSQSVEKGKTAAKPEAPEKEGYTFAGWYTDKEFKTAYDFEAQVEANVTLYANWIENAKEDTNGNTNQIILTLGETKAIVFGEEVASDVAPKAVNNRTMLPARLVAESLGATVTWSAEEPTKVLITKGDIEIIIYIGSDIAYVNGEEVALDSPAFAENNRTYTPIRFIAEELGAKVDWNPETNQAIITVVEEATEETATEE